MAKDFDELNQSIRGGQYVPPVSIDDDFAKLNQNVRASQIPGTLPPRPKEKYAGAADDANFAGNTLQVGPLDTGIPLPASVSKGLAQLGSGFANLPLRGRQLVGAATRGDVDEKNAIDKPLNAGAAGTINSIMGDALPYAAAPVIRAAGAVGPLLNAGAQGALQGYMRPLGTGDSASTNTGVGAASALAIPGASEVVKSLLTAGSPALKELAAKAVQQYGIPLSAMDVSQNRMVRALGSIFDQTGLGADQTAAKKKAFTEAALDATGSPPNSSTLDAGFLGTRPQPINDANGNITGYTPGTGNYGRVGTAYNGLAQRNDLHITPELMGDIAGIGNVSSLDGNLGDQGNTVGGFMTKVQGIADRAAKNPDGSFALHPQSGLPYVPGPQAMAYQQMLGNAGTDPSGVYGNKLQSVLRNHFDQQIGTYGNPEDQGVLAAANRDYRALKTLEPISDSNNNAVANREPGSVGGTQLSNPVKQQYGDGDSPFGDLPEIGQKFINNGSVETGGGPKALLQGMAITGLGGGAGLGTLLGVGPMVGSLAGAGAMTAGATAANSVLRSPALYNWAAGLGPEATPGIINAMKQLGVNAGTKAIPAAGALALTDGVADLPKTKKSEEERVLAAGQGALAATAAPAIQPDTASPSPDPAASDTAQPSPDPQQ